MCMVHPDVRLSISWTGQMLPYLSLYGYINVWLFIVHYHTWAEIPWAYITVTLHHLPQFVNIYLHKEIEWGTSVNKVNFWDKLIDREAGYLRNCANDCHSRFSCNFLIFSIWQLANIFWHFLTSWNSTDGLYTQVCSYPTARFYPKLLLTLIAFH